MNVSKARCSFLDSQQSDQSIRNLSWVCGQGQIHEMHAFVSADSVVCLPIVLLVATRE